jgi:hypothetical protein
MSLRTLLAMLVMMVATAIPARAPAATKTTPETALHRIQRTVAAIDAEAKTPGGETRVLSRLSAQLGVPADTLSAEHDVWGLGYGELAMAHSFARASRTGKNAGDVVAMRNSGMQWPDIAKQLGVKVDTVANRMKRHVPPKAKR